MSSEHKPIWIYCLVDPRNKMPMYVGLSRCPEKRFIQHMRSSASRVSLWVSDLASVGMTPTMDMLECCTTENALSRERYWMQVKVSDNQGLLNTIGNPVCSSRSAERLEQPSLWNTGKTMSRFRLDEDLISFISRTAKKSGVSKTAVVEVALLIMKESKVTPLEIVARSGASRTQQ